MDSYFKVRYRKAHKAMRNSNFIFTMKGMYSKSVVEKLALDGFGDFSDWEVTAVRRAYKQDLCRDAKVKHREEL